MSDSNLYDFEKTMKVIANLSVSAPTNLTVCGTFTFLMAMWSGEMRVYVDAILVACMCGSQGWTLWSIDSVPGGRSPPHICIAGFIRCLVELSVLADRGSS